MRFSLLLRGIVCGQFLAVFSLLFVPLHTKAQDSLRLTSRTRFHNGGYTTHEAWQRNRPSVPLDSLKGAYLLSPSGATIVSTDARMRKFKVFCLDGVAYTAHTKTTNSTDTTTTTFYQLPLLGLLCYYTFDEEHTRRLEMPVYDPQSGRLLYVRSEKRTDIETVRKLLDWRTGREYDFTLAAFARLAADDPKLLNSLRDLRPAEAQTKLFKCLLIYNDRHAAYLTP